MKYVWLFSPAVTIDRSIDPRLSGAVRRSGGRATSSPRNLNQAMSDLNRGIMKFKGADSPLAIALSATFILGGIVALILWALKSAYSLG